MSSYGTGQGGSATKKMRLMSSEDYWVEKLKKWNLFAELLPCFLSQFKHVFVFREAGNNASLRLTTSVQRAMITTIDGSLYAMGDNSHNMLRPTTTQRDSQLPTILAPFDTNFIGFSMTKNTVVAWTDKYRFYTWGRNICGDLGLPLGIKECKIGGSYTGWPFDTKPVTKVCHGAGHYLCLMQNGDLWAWGLNGNGQCGQLPCVAGVQPTQLRVPESKVIIDIDCSSDASFALTADGEVFGFGSLVFGLPAMNTTNFAIGRKIPFDDNPIKKIACGSHHHLALTADGSVYAWGSNKSGEVGNGTMAKVMRPIKLKSIPDPVVDIAAPLTWECSFAKTSEKVYAWGKYETKITHLSPTEIQVSSGSSFQDVIAECGFGMSQTLTTDLQPREEGSSIESLFDNKDNHDVVLEIVEDEDEPKKIYCFKFFLQQRCPYFEKMFTTWRESLAGNTPIPIHGFKYKCYHVFLKYLHCDQLDLHPFENNDYSELLKIADFHQTDSFKSKLIEWMKKEMSLISVVRMYGAAVEHKIRDLQWETLMFIKSNNVGEVLSCTNKNDFTPSTSTLLQELHSLGVWGS